MKRRVLLVLILLVVVIGFIVFFIIRNYDNLIYSFYENYLKKDISIDCVTLDVSDITNYSAKLFIDLDKMKAYYIVAGRYPEYDPPPGIDAKSSYYIKEKKKINLSQEMVDRIIQFFEDLNNIEVDIYDNKDISKNIYTFKTRKKCYRVTYKNEQKYYKFENLKPIIEEILNEK